MGAPLTRAEMLKGARFGAYEIVRHIGQGATSAVFEGRHVALQKAVAIKVLHEHLANDAQVAGRFMREGRVAARLRHPHALDVMDVGEEQGVAYLVMELLEGQDLKAHLAESGPLPLADAIAYLLPIASALAHAHDLGAVHRDLKPANVFLARAGRGGVVPMLVDFGLSKLDGVEDAKPLTGSEIVAGTVSYMAPEQTYGVAKAGPPADQFSLAMILYECIVGQVPFAAATLYQLIEEIRRAVVKPPSLCVPSLPPAIDDVLLRALARTPEKRWPSVRAFARALLPLADEATASAWRSDFSEAERAPAAGSRPRGRAAAMPNDETLGEVPGLAKAEPRIAGVPPLPVPAGTSPFRIKGLAYRGLALLATRSVGGGLATFIESFGDASLRDFARQAFLASGRYDILPLYPMTAAIARALGAPLDEVVQSGARAQARYDAKTIFRRMLASVGPDELAPRVERYGAQYYDFGPLDAILEKPGVMLLRHAGLPEYVAPWYMPMQAAYFEELVRALGGGDATSERLPPERGPVVAGLPTIDVRLRVRWS